MTLAESIMSLEVPLSVVASAIGLAATMAWAAAGIKAKMTAQGDQISSKLDNVVSELSEVKDSMTAMHEKVTDIDFRVVHLEKTGGVR